MTVCSAEDIKARKAWRGLLVPAVGSAAFFAATLINVINLHKNHGWPKDAFKKTDYVLMAIPFIIIALAIGEEVNGEGNEG